MKNLVYLFFVSILKDDKFGRFVLPHLISEYFYSRVEKDLLVFIQQYVLQYNSIPDITEIEAYGGSNKSWGEQEAEEFVELVNFLKNNEAPNNREWLVKECEKFCQQRAIYNALQESILIYDDESNKLDKKNAKSVHAIPQILTSALSVSFNQSIGHDYLDDAGNRYEHYHLKEKRIPFRLSRMNDVTGGGVPQKKLIVPIAGTNVGKSAFCADWAAFLLTAGYNVGYITLEMSEEDVAERIDANLMKMTTNDLRDLPKMIYEKQISRIKENYKGKIKIKEFPTSSGHVNHFRYLLDEWQTKSSFIPDILFVDYINICASARLKGLSDGNSYHMIKFISEELRGLAVEKNIPVVSPTQTNREGFGNSDAGLTDIAESFGLAHTADFMFVMFRDDNLANQNQAFFKIVKSRFTSKCRNQLQRFPVGFDESKMTFFDWEDGTTHKPENNQINKSIKPPNQKKSVDFSGIIM